MSQLPPPPPGPFPQQPPTSSAQPAAAARPAWRSGTAGWVILNIAIGLAIGFGVFIVAVIAGVSGHYDFDAIDRLMNEVNALGAPTPEAQRVVFGLFGAFVVPFASSLLGWLLFTYLRVRSAVRAALLIALVLGGTIVSFALMAAVLPKLPGY